MALLSCCCFIVVVSLLLWWGWDCNHHDHHDHRCFVFVYHNYHKRKIWGLDRPLEKWHFLSHLLVGWRHTKIRVTNRAKNGNWAPHFFGGIFCRQTSGGRAFLADSIGETGCFNSTTGWTASLRSFFYTFHLHWAGICWVTTEMAAGGTFFAGKLGAAGRFFLNRLAKQGVLRPPCDRVHHGGHFSTRVASIGPAVTEIRLFLRCACLLAHLVCSCYAQSIELMINRDVVLVLVSIFIYFYNDFTDRFREAHKITTRPQHNKKIVACSFSSFEYLGGLLHDDDKRGAKKICALSPNFGLCLHACHLCWLNSFLLVHASSKQHDGIGMDHQSDEWVIAYSAFCQMVALFNFEI